MLLNIYHLFLFFQRKKKENLPLNIRTASSYVFLPARAQFSDHHRVNILARFYSAQQKLIDVVVPFHYFYSHVYGFSIYNGFISEVQNNKKHTLSHRKSQQRA